MSRTDCAIRRGEWWGADETLLPVTPGVDIVGKLFSIDSSSQKRYNLHVGDRVLTLCVRDEGPPRGGNARYIALKPDHLVKVPETIDPALASCLPETYLTAFQVLHLGTNDEIRYSPYSLQGQSIMIVGKAISNLGRALSQIGNSAGAYILALCPSGHFSKISAMGVTPLDINSIEWWDEVSSTIDSIICIDDDVATIHYRLLKSNGRVVHINSADCGASKLGSLIPLPRDGRKGRNIKETQQQPQDMTKVYDVFEEWRNHTERCKQDLQYLLALLGNEELDPRLLDRVSLDKVENAHELLTCKRLNGFIVCEPWLVAKSRAVLL